MDAIGGLRFAPHLLPSPLLVSLVHSSLCGLRPIFSPLPFPMPSKRGSQAQLDPNDGSLSVQDLIFNRFSVSPVILLGVRATILPIFGLWLSLYIFLPP